MENITVFCNFCENYGVPKTGTFQTVDLFEGRNMAQVLTCIQQLGSEVSIYILRIKHYISMQDNIYRFINTKKKHTQEIAFQYCKNVSKSLER